MQELWSYSQSKWWESKNPAGAIHAVSVYLAVGDLRLVQIVVCAVFFGQELLMRTVLQDFAVAENVNAIRVLAEEQAGENDTHYTE